MGLFWGSGRLGVEIGPILGSFWGLFWACLYRKNGGFWPILGSFWARLGVEMGSNWAYFGAYFGPICIGKMGVFGLFWGHFGPILGCFGALCHKVGLPSTLKTGVFLGVSKWQHGFFRTPKRVKNGQWGDMGSFWGIKTHRYRECSMTWM